MSKTDKCRNEGAFNLAKAVREMKREANQHIRPRKETVMVKAKKFWTIQ